MLDRSRRGSQWLGILRKYMQSKPFLLIDAYAGINDHYRETAEFRLNLGLRNLGNSAYQEPYTALPGFKRALIGGAQMALRF